MACQKKKENAVVIKSSIFSRIFSEKERYFTVEIRLPDEIFFSSKLPLETIKLSPLEEFF